MNTVPTTLPVFASPMVLALTLNFWFSLWTKGHTIFIQQTPNNLNLEGKPWKVWVIMSQSYRGMGFLLTQLSRVFSQKELTCFMLPNTRKPKKLTQKTIRHFKTTFCSNFWKLFKKIYCKVMEYVLSHYTLTNKVQVIEGKIIKKITWKEKKFTLS